MDAIGLWYTCTSVLGEAASSTGRTVDVSEPILITAFGWKESDDADAPTRRGERWASFTLQQRRPQ
jgi:hypothetical protein